MELIKLNDYPLNEPSKIELPKPKDNTKEAMNEFRKKITKLRKILKHNYNFYVSFDEFDNVAIRLEPCDFAEFGSERFMWVSAEEEEFILNNRELENQERAKKEA